MRSITFYAFFSLFCLVFSKTTKVLTESIGQEVIEIAGPKELPLGIEEEPSAESDDDVLKATISKKEIKKFTTTEGQKKLLKDFEKIDATAIDDEEVRLEKEMAEIYKDPEYKDSSEVTNETTEATNITSVDTDIDTEKPIARARGGFKFAPDSTNKADIEKFRTSVDDINCNERQRLKVTHKITTTTESSTTPSFATKLNVTFHLLINLVFLKIVCI